MAQYTVEIDEVCIYPSGKDLLSPLENLYEDQYTLIEQSTYFLT